MRYLSSSLEQFLIIRLINIIWSSEKVNVADSPILPLLPEHLAALLNVLAPNHLNHLHVGKLFYPFVLEPQFLPLFEEILSLLLLCPHWLSVHPVNIRVNVSAELSVLWLFFVDGSLLLVLAGP